MIILHIPYTISYRYSPFFRRLTFGKGKLKNDEIIGLIKNNFELTPAGIIKTLNLRRPIYKQTAAYGHMGRTDIDLPWEHLDKVEALREQVQNRMVS